MRGITVCVEYADILSLTLPYNLHHFNEFMVVTTSRDAETIAVARQFGVGLHFTESFYANGALFNKWLALEEGLDALGRYGLMCIMDADVLWPKQLPRVEYLPGFLYSPLRRIQNNVQDPVPPEVLWDGLPLFTDYEWAGYTQIFYADDPVLPKGHWHQTDWLHAGGADSYFQGLWPRTKKIRPAWQCLHLGHPGVNWCGRVTPLRDGTKLEQSPERAEQLRRMLRMRKQSGNYTHEKILKSPPI